MNSAFYDIYSSYEENWKKGPPVLLNKIKPPKRIIKKPYKFLGFEVDSLFGIPAGPLASSKFMKAAFDWGFDVSTYKTIRSRTFPCHPYHNVLPVKIKGKLEPHKTPRLTAKDLKTIEQSNNRKISITNSFGVPSYDPSIWQKDVKKALNYVGNRQLLILSFMGTVDKDKTKNDFINDFAVCAKLSDETGAKVLEVNLSCPNLGNEGLVCFDLEITEKICKRIRKAIGNTPLLLKVGYYKNLKDLEKLAEIIKEYASGVAAINTLQVEVVNHKGEPALPGKNRLRSGICGYGIKWAGLEMVKKINEIRVKKNFKFSIVGVGGVMTPKDYSEYRNAGADLVQSATGAMFNPYLAYEIWKEEEKLDKKHKK